MRLPGRGLPRNVKVLSWVSFFQDAASELLYPIFPLFITGTLGAPASVLGLIEGIAEGTASIVKALSGRWADRFRRRPLIALGYGISSVAKPLIGLAAAWPFALFGRFVDRVGKGVRTSPRDALLVADTPPEIRGRAFGFHRGADTAGAVVGPLLGLALYEALGHELRPLFFIAAVPAAISVALIGFVHERPPTPEQQRARREPGPPASALPRRYWQLLVALAVFGLMNFSDALLILRANELGLSFVSIILVYTLYNAAYAGLSLPAGIVSDRLSRRVVYGSGLLIFSVAYLGLGLVHSPGWVWVLLPLYGAYTALTDGVGKAWVSDLLPERAMGTGLGLFQGVTGGCMLVASIWAGLIWGGDGRLPLQISGAVVGVLAVVLLVAGRRVEREHATIVTSDERSDMPQESAPRTGAVRAPLDPAPVQPGHEIRFADRHDAGRRLAALLMRFRDEDPVVVGIPRGGVPVAAEVAAALEAPLDVAVVRKIGAPHNREYAIGALAEGGVRILSDEAVRACGVEAGELDALVARTQAELDERLRRYRGDRAPAPIAGRTVLLVDDGLATGRSARAAADSLRARGAARIVLAVPVAAPDSVRDLADCVDEAVCVETPVDLWAIGFWYQDFRSTPDEEVTRLLARHGAPA